MNNYLAKTSVHDFHKALNGAEKMLNTKSPEIYNYIADFIPADNIFFPNSSQSIGGSTLFS